ncbi:transposase [Streptomyces sp. NPDC048172]|uniref:transposase n=1 Tax=Streptomyces sp. NPDC048172 TaxID=3365505 RepID=UPI00371A3A5D
MESLQVKTALAQCPDLQAAERHIRAFGQMLTERRGDHLDAWITEVEASGLPGLRGFARSLHSDHDAVAAGLTVPYSSGGTEGAVNRIKKIKRQLYGRSGFELLRKLILHQ